MIFVALLVVVWLFPSCMKLARCVTKYEISPSTTGRRSENARQWKHFPTWLKHTDNKYIIFLAYMGWFLRRITAVYVILMYSKSLFTQPELTHLTFSFNCSLLCIPAIRIFKWKQKKERKKMTEVLLFVCFYQLKVPFRYYI